MRRMTGNATEAPNRIVDAGTERIKPGAHALVGTQLAVPAQVRQIDVESHLLQVRDLGAPAIIRRPKAYLCLGRQFRNMSQEQVTQHVVEMVNHRRSRL